MNNNNITPPPELVRDWCIQRSADTNAPTSIHDIATQAARWGADQELEALLTWLRGLHFVNLADDLLAARRPKPSTLKELALKVLPVQPSGLALGVTLHPDDIALVRRALEQLPDDPA